MVARRAETGENRVTQATPPIPGSCEIVERTDVGCVRSHNEDRVEHRIPMSSRVRARKGVLCLVADGMGGYRAGEVASQEAVDVVMRSYYRDASRDAGASLQRALRAANAAIHASAEADPSRAGMGTTLVGAVIRGTQVTVANVGDSRAYYVGRKGIARITQDHSWVEEQVRAGYLTAEDARAHPQRNLVTRALGTRPAVEVDLFEGVIEAGDWLVLCSDGLTNVVQDREIESTVGARRPDEAAQVLVDLARQRGGRDNITVLLVRTGQELAADAAQNGRRSGAWLWTRLLLGTAVLLLLVALALRFLPA